MSKYPTDEDMLQAGANNTSLVNQFIEQIDIEDNDHEESYVEEFECYPGGSTSSLSGGFTTITNLADENNSGGNQNHPSRSIFQIVGVEEQPSPYNSSTTLTRSQSQSNNGDNNSLNNNSNLGGSFASYYNMQRNGPFMADTHIRPDEVLQNAEAENPGYLEEGEGPGITGGFCDNAECINVSSDLSTNDGRGSSLSSITHDFFPQFKGRFVNSGRVGGFRLGRHSSTHNISCSPQSSQENETPRKKVNSKKILIPMTKRKKNNLVQGSPWYSIALQPTIHHHHDITSPSRMRQLQQMPDLNHQHQLDPEHINFPEQPFRIKPPKEVLINTPHGGKMFDSDKLNSYPTPSDTPSIISSNGVSQLFTNELRERYRRSIYRSYGHHYRRFISSNARKSIVICVCLALIIGVVATTAVIMSNRNGTSNAASAANGVTIAMPTRDDIPSVCCVDGYNPQGQDGESDPQEVKEQDAEVDKLIEEFDEVTYKDEPGFITDTSPLESYLESNLENKPIDPPESVFDESSPSEAEIAFSVAQLDAPSTDSSPEQAPMTTSPAWNQFIVPPTPKPTPDFGALLAFLPTPRPISPPPTPRPVTNAPSTRRPTQQPSKFPSRQPITPSPTDPTNGLPLFKIVGQDGDDVFPLQLCEGDCDRDDDCAEGLVCMKRNIDDRDVPGCSGIDTQGNDFCVIDTSTPSPSRKPTKRPT